MVTVSDRIRRRTFLVGGAVSLGLGLARIGGAAPGTRPTRLLIYYIPHGQPIEHVAADDIAQSRVLEPLAPFSGVTQVVRGLSMNDGATNHPAIRATLTGFSEGGSGDSIDSIIADALGETPYALGTLPYSPGGGFSSDSYLMKRGTWVRPLESPVEAARRMLGAGGGSGDPMPDEHAFRQAALELTEGELDAVAARVSALPGEHEKVLLHLDAVRELKSRGTTPPVDCGDGSIPPEVTALEGIDFLDQANLGRILQGHLRVTAAAFACGSARVVGLQNLWVNSNVSMGFAGGPGVAKGHHEPISHSWDAAGRAEFATCQRWFYEQLATHFLSLLEIPDPLDPAHTVLDNTVVYVCSEVSDGANHNSDASEVWVEGKGIQTYLPALLIGGGGGLLRGGGMRQVSGTHTRMLATLAHVMGAPIDTLGGQPVSTLREVLA